jgi:hypothetical protein
MGEEMELMPPASSPGSSISPRPHHEHPAPPDHGPARQETYGLIGGNIFHEELSASQLFHMRPAPGYADFPPPDPRPLLGLVDHPRQRRWRHRHPALQVVKAVLKDL